MKSVKNTAFIICKGLRLGLPLIDLLPLRLPCQLSLVWLSLISSNGLSLTFSAARSQYCSNRPKNIAVHNWDRIQVQNVGLQMFIAQRGSLNHTRAIVIQYSYFQSQVSLTERGILHILHRQIKHTISARTMKTVLTARCIAVNLSFMQAILKCTCTISSDIISPLLSTSMQTS